MPASTSVVAPSAACGTQRAIRRATMMPTECLLGAGATVGVVDARAWRLRELADVADRVADK